MTTSSIHSPPTRRNPVSPVTSAHRCFCAKAAAHVSAQAIGNFAFNLAARQMSAASANVEGDRNSGREPSLRLTRFGAVILMRAVHGAHQQTWATSSGIKQCCDFADSRLAPPLPKSQQRESSCSRSSFLSAAKAVISSRPVPAPASFIQSGVGGVEILASISGFIKKGRASALPFHHLSSRRPY